MTDPIPQTKRSLSTKLLLLIISFILLAELVVMIPSVAKQRYDWLNTRIEEAYLVSFALEAPRQQVLDEEVARQLFSTANILGVTINQDDMRMLILAPEIDPHGPPNLLDIDLRETMLPKLVVDAWGTLFSSGNKLIQVTGAPQVAPESVVDIIISQRALRQNLQNYSRNILIISLAISVMTAALVFWALNIIIVGPVRRLKDNMVSFENDPENPDGILIPSARFDEIGAAEQSLAKMEGAIQQLLHERRRLAALGAGISKISHDLRNILASAQLMSDRLAKSDDPRVQKLSPRLISALDRAITLSRDTLTFGKVEARTLRRETVNLHALAEEVLDDTAAMQIAAHNEVPETLNADIDRTQLYRALFNLVRNAIEAMTQETTQPNESNQTLGNVTISSEENADHIVLTVIDTGLGIPEAARQDLFEPFKGSLKPGGTGLGVAISAEILRAHGGVLELERSDEKGTHFKMTLPKVAPAIPA